MIKRIVLLVFGVLLVTACTCNPAVIGSQAVTLRPQVSALSTK